MRQGTGFHYPRTAGNRSREATIEQQTKKTTWIPNVRSGILTVRRYSSNLNLSPMKPDFWLERWERNEISFHRTSTHPALTTYWHQIAVDHHAPVFVPLCGKSRDLLWLSQYGHRVVGIEFSAKAISEFFLEWGRNPERKENSIMTCWQAKKIGIVQGDFFEYYPEKPFQYFYDRAALVALPERMRARYLDHLAGCLAPKSSGLLVTLEYDQKRMDGPPFSVTRNELSSKSKLNFEQLASQNVISEYPHFAERGLDELFETIYRVTKI